MGRIRSFLSSVWDRRKVDIPVDMERRHPTRLRDADRMVKESRERLEQAIKQRLNGVNKKIANDCQQTVVFSTYRDICPSKGPEIGGVKLCRDKHHPDASSNEITICEEDKCPRLALAVKGIAA